jgi:hypothetical protein
MNRPHVRLWLLIALSPTLALGADVIYRSTDAQGHPNFSDRPSEAAQVIVLRSTAAAATDVDERIAAERAALAASEQARKAKAESDRASRAEKEQAERARKGRCEQAQSRVRTLANERQVFTYNATLERVYPSNAELEAQRSAARVEAEQYCD